MITDVATPSVATEHFSLWGTNGTLGVTEPASLDDARQILDAEIAATDAAASRFRPDGEILALNAAAGTGLFEVSPALLDLVRAALHASRVTAGACDPTVLDSLMALGYDRDFDALKGHAVDPGTDRLAPSLGISGIVIDDAASSISLPSGVHLDLGASAKARTADRAAESIVRLLGIGCLVDLGGDLRVAGAPPAEGWIIGVTASARTPLAGHADELIALTTGGLASSSTQIRRWQHGTEAVHHIIDPRTGHSALSPWQMVTATASSCLEANALTTASIVWGEDALFELPQHGAAARLVRLDGSVERVGGWPMPDHAGAA